MGITRPTKTGTPTPTSPPTDSSKTRLGREATRDEGTEPETQAAPEADPKTARISEAEPVSATGCPKALPERLTTQKVRSATPVSRTTRMEPRRRPSYARPATMAKAGFISPFKALAGQTAVPSEQTATRGIARRPT